MILIFSGLNAFLNLAREEVPDSKVLPKTQEPVTKTQMQEKNKKTRRDRLSCKFKYDK